MATLAEAEANLENRAPETVRRDRPLGAAHHHTLWAICQDPPVELDTN